MLRLAGHSSSCVNEAVKYSEESRTKCIGLTIETRPDYCLGPHLRDMLTYGCTRIEMGVQVRAVVEHYACVCMYVCLSLATRGHHNALVPSRWACRSICTGVCVWGPHRLQLTCILYHLGLGLPPCLQSVYEDVARDTNRGHTVEAVKECFCLAKDAGFKVRQQGLRFRAQAWASRVQVLRSTFAQRHCDHSRICHRGSASLRPWRMCQLEQRCLVSAVRHAHLALSAHAGCCSAQHMCFDMTFEPASFRSGGSPGRWH
jgi:hypothetical protein